MEKENFPTSTAPKKNNEMYSIDLLTLLINKEPELES